MEITTKEAQVSNTANTVPAWYAEMVDPEFHKKQVEARATLLAMMMPKK